MIDGKEEAMNADLNDEKLKYRDAYEANLDEIANVIEDFPEYKFFEEAGELLRQALRRLRQASDSNLESHLFCECMAMTASRINKFLNGKQ